MTINDAHYKDLEESGFFLRSKGSQVEETDTEHFRAFYMRDDDGRLYTLYLIQDKGTGEDREVCEAEGIDRERTLAILDKAEKIRSERAFEPHEAYFPDITGYEL